jgi:CspA family cold shock protein
MARQTGVVKWFSDEKGYGFIRPDDQSPECFVHFTNIRKAGRGRRNLTEGGKVEYESQPGKKGPEAIDVVEIG